MLIVEVDDGGRLVVVGLELKWMLSVVEVLGFLAVK